MTEYYCVVAPYFLAEAGGRGGRLVLHYTAEAPAARGELRLERQSRWDEEGLAPTPDSWHTPAHLKPHLKGEEWPADAFEAALASSVPCLELPLLTEVAREEFLKLELALAAEVAPTLADRLLLNPAGRVSSVPWGIVLNAVCKRFFSVLEPAGPAALSTLKSVSRG